jgi:predicted nucleic acid-binding protein
VNFASIPAGEPVFVDANVFVYDFGPDPLYGPPCNALLKRVEEGEVRGFTSSLVMHDVAHRAMTVEACQTFGWPYAGIGRRLKNNSSEVQRLTRFRRMLDAILAIGVEVLDVKAEHVLLAADISRAHGLLSGDALVVAVMQSHGIVNLASGDEDFDRVPGIVHYSPL